MLNILRVRQAPRAVIPLSRRCLLSSSSRLPSLIIRTISPLELRAVWSDDVTIASSNQCETLQSNEDENQGRRWLIVERSNPSLSGETSVQISVPRRCASIQIESTSGIQLSGDDRLEIEQGISIRAEGEVRLGCTIRGQTIDFYSGKSITTNKAVEGVKVNLHSRQSVAAKRIGAKVLSIISGTGLDVHAMYADEIHLQTQSGNAKVGTSHGALDVKVNQGDLIVESVSGSISAEVAGNAEVHLEESHPDASNVVHCGKQAKVTLAVTTLPVSIRGTQNVTMTDPDVAFRDGRLELSRPSAGDGSGVLVVHGNDESSVSLLSWIESVKLKAAKKHGFDPSLLP